MKKNDEHSPNGHGAHYSQPESHYDVIEEGPYSTVARMWTDGAQWIAVKSASTLRKFTREPHDILKELRLLSEISHPNVLDIMGSFRDDEQLMQNIYMPFLPISLVQLLASPYFTPHPFPPDTHQGTCKLKEEQFIVIAKSLMFQVLCAVAFLHDNTRKIAHRDIKPGNIMLSREGCVKLIDFGISSKNEPDTEKTHDLWPESQQRLYFEVSTGPYRAPELLFGTRTYNPLAIDLWSLGATFAQLFTALRLCSAETDDWDDDDAETDTNPELDNEPPTPFIVPKYLRIGYPGTEWTRVSLFNGEKGEIGLTWSIFKIFGTPTAESWPEFDELPGAKTVVFSIVPPVPLPPLLPNLPPSSVLPSATASFNDNASSEVPKNSVLNLLQQFLLYPPGSRIRAEDALHHSWFTNEDSVMLLPKGYSLEDEYHHVTTVVDEWQGKSLEEWLPSIIPASPAG